MKKVITLALALLLVCSMAIPAFAATTTLTTTVPQATYTLNIPANQEITFGTTKSSIGNITVTDAQGFAVGKNLDVMITYDSFSAEGISTTIPYELSLHADATATNAVEGEQNIPSGSIVTFKGQKKGTVEEFVYIQAMTNNGIPHGISPVTQMYFNANSEDWGKALAGEYTTTITFTAEVVAE